MSIECSAKGGPTTCRNHKNSPEALLMAAASSNNFEAYAQAKELAEKKPAGTAAFVHDEQYRNVKKMPALFVINRETHEATTAVNPAADWIFSEPSRPTYKKDGTSITVTEDGTIYARRAVKKGKNPPPGFIPAETDSFTGHTFGLEPIAQSGFSKMFKE
jgi:hypothetical protein